MQLTLVLPNLLDAEPDALAAADAPALARLLSTAASPVAQPGGALGLACESLGIAKQYDWPAAPWLARAAGIDPGKRYWLCAQPLTLALERGEGRVAGAINDLNASESASLLSVLRAHFASDGLEFVEGAPARWWAALADPQRLETSPPGAALGKPIVAHLPRGDDGARWRRWQSEMQMLLFEHPVNRARESEGRSKVDYVWVWGGGTLRDASPDGRATTVFADAPLLRDLSRATGHEAAALPPSFAALRASPAAASSLVWLDDIEIAALPEQLAVLDARWAAPLERALDKGEIDARLVVAGSETALSFAPRAAGAMQRLRRRWSAAPALPLLLKVHHDA
jgi:hypothetical protein